MIYYDVHAIICGYFTLLICNHFSRNSLSRKVVLQPEKRWVYSINPPFFLGLQPEKKAEFAEQFFKTTFLEKWLQIKRLCNTAHSLCPQLVSQAMSICCNGYKNHVSHLLSPTTIDGDSMNHNHMIYTL